MLAVAVGGGFLVPTVPFVGDSVPLRVAAGSGDIGKEVVAAEDILAVADELNGRPRRKLGYCTPEELFEAFLDTVYVA